MQTAMPHAVQVIRRIDVPVRDIKWSDSGELVAILSDQSFYVLRFARDVVDAFMESGQEVTLVTMPRHSGPCALYPGFCPCACQG